VPSPMLEEVACAGLEHGKHVFVETMGILTPEGAPAARAGAEDRPGHPVGYSREYAPIYMKMKASWRMAATRPRPASLAARYFYGSTIPFIR